jgi:spoIIIJ-associated protein
MEEYIRVTGKTVEDALLEASIMLGTTSDNIEYRVIEHESKGFLGIGARKAVIEARARKTEEDFISEIFSEKPVKEQKEKAGEQENTQENAGSQESGQ